MVLAGDVQQGRRYPRYKVDLMSISGKMARNAEVRLMGISADEVILKVLENGHSVGWSCARTVEKVKRISRNVIRNDRCINPPLINDLPELPFSIQ